MQKTTQQQTRECREGDRTTSDNGFFDFKELVHGLMSLCDDTELVLCLDNTGIVIDFNEGAAKTHFRGKTRSEIIGFCIWDLLPPAVSDRRKAFVDRVIATGTAKRIEDQNNGFWFDSIVYPVFDRDRNVRQVLILGRDITRRKEAEAEIRELNQRLEQRVKERTAELEAKTHRLEDLNTTLRVLLEKRQEDKDDLEERMVCNIKQLIIPYVETLITCTTDVQHREMLKTMHGNLHSITSCFSRNLSSGYLNLTPKEIQVASLIKEGKTTKEIAEFINTSLKTVEVHREHIRKKLGLKHRTANLRTHLLTAF
jgi:PAS domain S-box-containing protein